jgi:hypothetical protein
MSVWHEVTVVGHEKTARAFVAGFVIGRGASDPVLFGQDVGVRAGSLSTRLHDLLAAGAHHTLLAPEAVATPLASALERLGEDLGLRLEGHAEVMSASLEFSAEVYSEVLAERVRSEMREALPPGVTLERFADHEHRASDARGTELYAPAHAFTYSASGRVAGTLPGVLEMHRRAAADEFVKLAPITLDRRELPLPTRR